jgi:hypothetical protein
MGALVDQPNAPKSVSTQWRQGDRFAARHHVVRDESGQAISACFKCYRTWPHPFINFENKLLDFSFRGRSGVTGAAQPQDPAQPICTGLLTAAEHPRQALK